MNSWDKYELDDFAKMFFNSGIAKNADDLKSKFETSYKDLRIKLEMVEKVVRHASYNGWDDIKYIWNLAGFILTISLSQFRNEHQSSLKSIRKIIGAHRDHDFLMQIDAINSLSHSSFISVVTKFDSILNDLSVPLQSIINESVENFTRNMENKI